jgi:hypothetical protein
MNTTTYTKLLEALNILKEAEVISFHKIIGAAETYGETIEKRETKS